MKELKRTNRTRGQMMVEYAIVFTVMIAVILFATITIYKPALVNYFTASGEAIKKAAVAAQNAFH